MPAKIDIVNFAKEASRLLENAKVVARVYDDPYKAFDGLFCDGGVPMDFRVCWEDAVTIFFEEISGHRFSTTSGTWSDPFDGKLGDRILRVDDQGVLGEVEPDGKGTVTEWFPVETASEIVEIAKFFCSKAAFTPSRGSRKMLPASSLVDELYVPIFRYPDDIDLEDSGVVWASTKRLKGLIEDHLQENIPWLDPAKWELRRLELRRKIKKKKGRADDPQIDVIADGQPVSATSDELAYALFEAFTPNREQWEKRYFEYAASLTDDDILNSDDSCRLLETAILYARRTGSEVYDLRLPIRIKLNKTLHARFFRADVNPQSFDILTSAALAPLLLKESGEHSDLLDVPPLSEQIKTAFESARYQHALNVLGRRLNLEGNSGKEPVSAIDQLKRKRFRYYSVSRMLNTLPANEGELLRAVHPLPFFIETPLIRWERANDKLRFHSSIACLQQLLKISCLLGLEELHANRGKIGDFVPPKTELLDGLKHHPSLGHWLSGIGYLAEISAYFPVWGPWLQYLHDRRGKIVELIAARNRIAHPNYVIEPEFISSIDVQFAELFDEIFPKLRLLATPIEILLPRSRKATRDAEHRILFQFDCLDLKSATEPFPAVQKVLASDQSSELIENVLFCCRGSHVVPLSHYFQLRLIRPETTEIFVYDRDFDAGRGLVVGVTTGLSQKLELSPSIFTFT